MPTTIQESHAAGYWLGYGACALAGSFWGTGFYFGKIVLADMGVGHMVFYRFAFACVGLLPFALRHRPRLNRREWRLLLIAAFFGIPVQYLVQFYGLSLTTVSHASLMVGSMPVLLGAAATLFTGERLDRVGWLALVSSTIGVVLIVLSRHQSAGGKGPSLVGDLLVLAALLVSLFWILMNKRLMERHPPAVITVYGVYSGALMMAVWVLWQDGLPPVHGVPVAAWLASAASGLFCTAGAILLWNWGIHHVPASRAAVFLNIEPMLGSFLGVKLLGDRLGPSAWVGGVLIVAAAITLTSRPHGIDPSGVIE
ncbi:MAG TPA: EamA family transporter [Acidobacteriaceae bacterium]|jgi:drug/metabolite transporter (DMT)-like permease|nr:EamA family transporter [Acidobacteriaceae bacterium]